MFEDAAMKPPHDDPTRPLDVVPVRGGFVLGGQRFYLKVFGSNSRPLFVFWQGFLTFYVVTHLVYNVFQTKHLQGQQREDPQRR